MNTRIQNRPGILITGLLQVNYRPYWKQLTNKLSSPSIDLRTRKLTLNQRRMPHETFKIQIRHHFNQSVDNSAKNNCIISRVINNTQNVVLKYLYGWKPRH